MPQNTSTTPDQAGRWIITKFGGPDVLKWETWDPEAGLPADQVLVRIITAGIAGADNIQRVGGYPDDRCLTPGFTPGYDFVGEVVALGSSLSKDGQLVVGDRVASMCVLGAHATHIILPPSELIRIDYADDPVRVGALPLNYMTAWGMLRRSDVDLKPGSSILIGSVSGGVGTAMSELVHAFDIGIKMIGTCSPSKFDYVKSLGVIPIDRNAPDLVEQVRALTNGEGVDVAYDAVGSEDSLRKSYKATKKDIGHVIVIGIMSEIASDGSGLVQGSLADAEALLTSRLQPRMRFWGLVPAYYMPKRDLWLEDFRTILEKVREGVLVPRIAKLFRLSEAVEAHENLISGTAVKGRMVFVVDEDLATQHGL
ncbi:NAD(P)-binding protein [Hypomontagnella monticulosa]|nr:NAD(P)-binding protein [Hypomontagnella monticulosa]